MIVAWCPNGVSSAGFRVVPLCDRQIIVDTVVIANNERYSSQVQNFLVLGSQTYPATEWIVLGEFNAENRFGEQSFTVTSQSWVRYIKLRWAIVVRTLWRSPVTAPLSIARSLPCHPND